MTRRGLFYVSLIDRPTALKVEIGMLASFYHSTAGTKSERYQGFPDALAQPVLEAGCLETSGRQHNFPGTSVPQKGSRSQLQNREKYDTN